MRCHDAHWPEKGAVVDVAFNASERNLLVTYDSNVCPARREPASISFLSCGWYLLGESGLPDLSTPVRAAATRLHRRGRVEWIAALRTPHVLMIPTLGAMCASHEPASLASTSTLWPRSDQSLHQNKSASLRLRLYQHIRLIDTRWSRRLARCNRPAAGLPLPRELLPPGSRGSQSSAGSRRSPSPAACL